MEHRLQELEKQFNGLNNSVQLKLIEVSNKLEELEKRVRAQVKPDITPTLIVEIAKLRDKSLVLENRVNELNKEFSESQSPSKHDTDRKGETLKDSISSLLKWLRIKK